MVHYQSVEVRTACPAHCDRAGFPGTPLCKCCRENRENATPTRARGMREKTRIHAVTAEAVTQFEQLGNEQ